MRVRLAALALTSLFLAACSGGGTTPDQAEPPPAERTVRGLVENMTVTGGLLRAVAVRDGDGILHAYAVQDPQRINITIDHLREHQERKEPVTLLLQRSSDTYLIVRIDD